MQEPPPHWRHQTRLKRVVRRARFLFLKTIDDYDFTFQSTGRLSLLGSALSADFTTEGHCLIFNGKPARGKRHLAIAIAYRAIQHGFDALFVTAAELIADLSAAFRAGRFAAALAPYTHPSVLLSTNGERSEMWRAGSGPPMIALGFS